MKNPKYKTLLALDCICGYFLTIYERDAAINLYYNYGNPPLIPTERIIKILELIEHYKWEPPEFKIEQSQVMCFYDKDTESRQPIEKYQHPIINEIQKLK